MFIGGIINNFLLKILIKIFVKSRAISANLESIVNFDRESNIIYILPDKSQTDLITLQNYCQKAGLSDPLSPIEIAGNLLPHYVFLQDSVNFRSEIIYNLQLVELLNLILELHQRDSKLNMHIVFVSIIFERPPSRNYFGKNKIINYNWFSKINKLLKVCCLGRDSCIYFSSIISIRDIQTQYGSNKKIFSKLIRIARIHFIRQGRVETSSQMLTRSNLLVILLQSKVIKKAIAEEASSKRISHQKAQKNTITLIQEISANFSYIAIYLTDRIMRWSLGKLYQDINVRGSRRILDMAYKGHAIVYLPCHRSHMDYLLISYILYHQGLTLPYIAAGINLNFWPIGKIFRYLGAFFIRRTFNGNKLYSTIVREYVSQLFFNGYPVEYFIEGGRSRTGYLRPPKTGILLMTLQAMLRKNQRVITIIPIYIGYEHVIEVESYSNELAGAIKEKEGLFSILRALKNLRNFGQSYVNFGEPLSLIKYLDKKIPEWRKSIDPIKTQHPVWLTSAVHDIAKHIMIRINNAAAINAINLCVMALIGSDQYTLPRQQLTQHLNCYLQLLRNVPYSSDATVPRVTAEKLLEHALSMNQFEVKKNTMDDVVILPKNKVKFLLYYRNNIHHMFIIPALISAILIKNRRIDCRELYYQVSMVYPILESELFLHWSQDELPGLLDALVSEMERQGLLKKEKSSISLKEDFFYILQLLATGAQEALQRYTIISAILIENPTITRKMISDKSCLIAQRLSVLYGTHVLEFFDKTMFNTLIFTIRHKGYMQESKDLQCAKDQHLTNIYKILSNLIPQDIRITIERFVVDR
ncbi:glycerol-3-phosphate 1-O-acyltransferase PlsB [Candidatus Erwinia haradaeae]|uniref:Glycerol-3-phosphate acyltransferase n=1 Tax=Candidatus Erwinia haradaeae TaxID=1922217 RepID=A0A451D3P7_9GAMM|nr:glycerol-3-phosphate 1-O-acyltransferase PlsB [Candidatus Erwinia haradaeae]VFP80276.1 Glycerol-3-phosphate acyltransferase [Candidatus Erwinia haradaeae]